jgi:acyl carrier protein
MAETTSMSVRLTILTKIDEIAKEQGKNLKPLNDELILLESGLDSLCFAILVARLEDALETDPFTASDDEVNFPVTLGDFVRFYENVAA